MEENNYKKERNQLTVRHQKPKEEKRRETRANLKTKVIRHQDLQLIKKKIIIFVSTYNSAFNRIIQQTFFRKRENQKSQILKLWEIEKVLNLLSQIFRKKDLKDQDHHSKAK